MDVYNNNIPKNTAEIPVKNTVIVLIIILSFGSFLTSFNAFKQFQLFKSVHTLSVYVINIFRQLNRLH